MPCVYPGELLLCTGPSDKNDGLCWRTQPPMLAVGKIAPAKFPLVFVVGVLGEAAEWPPFAGICEAWGLLYAPAFFGSSASERKSWHIISVTAFVTIKFRASV